MSSDESIHMGFLLQDTGEVYGAERATLDLAQGLRDQPGFRVTILMIEEKRHGKGDSALRRVISRRGLPIETCSTHTRFSFALTRGIRRIAREQKIGILDCTGAKATVHGYLAVRGAPSIRLSATVHGWGVDRCFKARLYDSVERWALRRFDGVIVLSRFYGNVLRAYGFDREKVQRIRPGPIFDDLPDRRDPGPRSGPLVVGMPARFSPEKNHDLLLDAAKILAGQESELRFLLAGDGVERRRIAERVRREGLTRLVEMPGFLDRSDFFKRVDLVVLCSLVENQPYAILEAMACGIPVVATEAGGVAEMIEDGKTGLLVASNSAEALAEALKSLCDDPARREHMGSQAHDYFYETYRHDRCIGQYVDHYRRLAGSTE